MQLLDRAVIGALILLAMLLFGIQAAHASTNQLIPSIGATRAIHGDDALTPYAQLGLRTTWVPAVMTEVGVGYRKDKFDDGNLEIKSWPVTASLWLSPVPSLYAGGGVGWYNSTLNWSDASGNTDKTTQKFGLHLGGGMTIPVTPAMGLDLNAKYVFMEKIDSDDLEFDPSHWSTSAGLAFRF